MDSRTTLAAMISLTCITVLPVAASSFTGQELSARAKVSLKSARAIALEARPGIIVDQELEQERGGGGLRYSFDIKSGNSTYEVGVDAASGRLLENSKEGPHPD